MDNEKYTYSLIDSIEDYIYKIQYLAANKRVTLRALNTYKIFHWIYNWADWFEVTEENKLKIEKLMNCLILRNSALVLPTIIPQTFYTNVSSPQNMWTWRILQNNANVITATNLGNKTLTVQSADPILVTINKQDTLGNQNGNPSFNRVYLTGEQLTITAPGLLSSGRLFNYWDIDGTSQISDNVLLLEMNVNHIIIAVYKDPTPPVGAIIINKEVLDSNGDPDAGDNTVFTVTLSKDGNEIEGALSQSYPLIFSNLEMGSYLITESSMEGYTIESDNPKLIILTAGANQNQTITITNKQVAVLTGTVTVTKAVLPPETELNNQFTYILLGESTGYYQNGTITEPAVFSNIPFGDYTLEEVQDGQFMVDSITPNNGIDTTIGAFTIDANHLDIDVTVTNNFNI